MGGLALLPAGGRGRSVADALLGTVSSVCVTDSSSSLALALLVSSPSAPFITTLLRVLLPSQLATSVFARHDTSSLTPVSCSLPVSVEFSASSRSSSSSPTSSMPLSSSSMLLEEPGEPGGRVESAGSTRTDDAGSIWLAASPPPPPPPLALPLPRIEQRRPSRPSMLRCSVATSCSWRLSCSDFTRPSSRACSRAIMTCHISSSVAEPASPRALPLERLVRRGPRSDSRSRSENVPKPISSSSPPPTEDPATPLMLAAPTEPTPFRYALTKAPLLDDSSLPWLPLSARQCAAPSLASALLLLCRCARESCTFRASRASSWSMSWAKRCACDSSWSASPSSAAARSAPISSRSC
mmetsp:Transcript_15099/g.42827  ORF Transcript_15099/g.42827 Transcript_15099/m.42827 type:complete len:354 (+) Transcript_15099:293-1354(+)